MKQGVSQIRNPVIARVFRELDLIEQWGSGIPGIFRQVRAQNLPEPQIEEVTGRVRFTVPVAEPFVPSAKQSRRGEKETAAEEQAKEAQSGAQSGAQSQKILFVLSDTPLSAQDLANVLELESKSGAFKRCIKDLRERGLIEYTIPNKPTSRLQKYRLTDKGRKMLPTSDT